MLAFRSTCCYPSWAGFPVQIGAEDIITEEEKRQLLTHLRESHGKSQTGAAGGPKKITLKRKTVTELRQPGAPGRTIGRGPATRAGGKTVECRSAAKKPCKAQCCG